MARGVATIPPSPPSTDLQQWSTQQKGPDFVREFSGLEGKWRGRHGVGPLSASGMDGSDGGQEGEEERSPLHSSG